jgi:hypothetical protein
MKYLGSGDSQISLSFSYRQIGYGVHPTSYLMGTGRSFTGRIKRLWCEADHSHPASAEVKKIWIYTSTPPYAFMA